MSEHRTMNASRLNPMLAERSIHIISQSKLKISRFQGIKPLFDFAYMIALSVVAVPIMAVVALVVLISDGRPVFYSQTRVGKNGKLFRIWKFRTMRTDAEASSGAVWCSQNDSRVTAVGYWLRCLHLDELPQFLNILLGDMNLIGPRPERPEFVKELTRQLPHYALRHAVRPGITGLAQLRLGYDRSFADVEKKVLLDLEYITTTTAWRDLALIIQTVPYVAKQLYSKQEVAVEPENAILDTAKTLQRPRLDLELANESRIPIPHFPALANLNCSNSIPQTQVR